MRNTVDECDISLHTLLHTHTHKIVIIVSYQGARVEILTGTDFSSHIPSKRK